MSMSSPQPINGTGNPMRADLDETATKAPARPTPAVQEHSPEGTPGAADTVSDQLKSGRLFACFELERELEIRDTGTVWLAQNYDVKRQADQVTLKFLPESIVRNKPALEDLKDQISRRVLFQHPNIQRAYDLVESKGRVAVQLEYLDGQSLSNLRSTKPNQVFEVRDLEKWTGELCGALDYARQEAGLVDIDVAPGNLIINPAGNLKLRNVGITNCIANSMSRLIAKDEPGKKLPFKSSQQGAGENPRVSDDLYSLGALLY